MSGLGGGTDAALALVSLVSDAGNLKSKLQEFKTREDAADKAEKNARAAIVDMQTLEQRTKAAAAELGAAQARFTAQRDAETARLAELETGLNQRGGALAEAQNKLARDVRAHETNAAAKKAELDRREQQVADGEATLKTQQAELARLRAALETRMRRLQEAMAP